jgi:AraC-like DNA-binding protein
LKLLDLFFLSTRAVSFYAEKLNITTNHLTILCHQYFGSTATKLINDRILLEAKKMLASGISVKETAYTLNFRDASYFSRYFKVHTKTTPKKFVAQHRID